MKQNKTYKILITAFLLALYAFIATPVQLWHQHSYDQNITTNKSVTEAKIIKETGQSAETNCQICSHHYSIYNKTDAILFHIPISVNNPKQGFYALSIPLEPYFNSTNKGPPSLA